MKALISVYDKTGLANLAIELAELGVEIIASGGTGQAIEEAGLQVTLVEDITGLPSVLGGRVKTLHPAIHAGILARDSEEDRRTLQEHNWDYIDLVIVNLYPFSKTVTQEGVSEAEVIDQIDIGGVALIRAAAKNYARVAVVTSPDDYSQILAELREYDAIQPDTRRSLATKAFVHTAGYDRAIMDYFAGDRIDLPAGLKLDLPKGLELRYGENPHQKAILYTQSGSGPLGAEQLQGKALSYNNLLDIGAAWQAAADFEEPSIVIVKHTSPCGAASNASLPDAFQHALASDPVSAFGGIVACNRTFTADLANTLGNLFVEAIAAPEYDPAALSILRERKNCRVMKMNLIPESAYVLQSVRGGILAQTPDNQTNWDWQIVTDRHPTDEEMIGLQFGWRVIKHVKSNAIVFTKGKATVGIGVGQPSRVDSVRLASLKAGEVTGGVVMASDAFFPFPDSLEYAAEVGVTAVVQPGGSIRDDQVIKAANDLGVAMCFTGTRHFRH